MSGFAAPKLETVRIGFIGLGNRGPYAVERITHIEGTAVTALCDIRPEKVSAVVKALEGSAHHPATYSGGKENRRDYTTKKRYRPGIHCHSLGITYSYCSICYETRQTCLY